MGEGRKGKASKTWREQSTKSQPREPLWSFGTKSSLPSAMQGGTTERMMYSMTEKSDWWQQNSSWDGLLYSLHLQSMSSFQVLVSHRQGSGSGKPAPSWPASHSHTSQWSHPIPPLLGELFTADPDQVKAFPKRIQVFCGSVFNFKALIYSQANTATVTTWIIYKVFFLLVVHLPRTQDLITQSCLVTKEQGLKY